MQRTLYLDLETYARDGIDDLLPDAGDAPSNWKDVEKIAAYKREAQQTLKDKAALDPDLAKIVAFGWAFDDSPVEVVLNCDDEAEIRILAGACYVINQADRIVGFNLPGFDLRVLSRRADLLAVEFPRLELGRYRFDHRILDLQHKLSFGDGPQKGKSLDWYANHLFKLPEGADDPHTGADIARLVKAGDWPAIEQHCRADVERTRALAKRLGYVRGREPAHV